MKRFYQKVGVDPALGGWRVLLDGRSVKTPGGAPQIAPSEALAHTLAAEWEAQGEKIDPSAMPLRAMADYALDVIAPDPASRIAAILPYGETDTLLYRADPEEPLYARQQEEWEPIVCRFEERHGLMLTRVSGIIARPQDPDAMGRLRSVLDGHGPFTLAALDIATSLAASLITGLEALEEGSDPSALWQAANLEEDWQAEQWGRDEEAEARRDRREADFVRACEFARLAAT
ncbi:ATP12 family chaperone protein [Erythrobacter sp.]|jgi:chaperone required for assembly of F1-ATPase|uniref:ATP12 family chaperone protein n=1 Tax=Erythrobacter sp. TaxID=1042 RepID=UPI002EC1827F|nr:ATP12 family protein [Erythrobacter sp.]